MGVRTATAAIFLTLALSGPGALAQLAGSDQTTPPAAPAPAAFPSTPELSASLMAPTVARELRRLALLELRAMDTPAGADYQCTEFLLSLADHCRADDVEQLRRRVEACFNAGDTAKVESLSRGVLDATGHSIRTEAHGCSHAAVDDFEGNTHAVFGKVFVHRSGKQKSCGFIEATHQVHVLNGLSSSTLANVVFGTH